jgi:hypothetical protein
MATLFESLSQALTPDIAGQVGKAIGLDTDLVSKGISVVGPLVTGSLASQASSPSGLDGIMKMLPKDTGVPAMGTLGSIVSALGSGGIAGNPQSNLLGAGGGAMAGTIDKALGFKASSLIPLAAPFVMNLLRQRMTTDRLDTQGVAKLLQDEHTAFTHKGDPSATLVRTALEAGQQAVATKAKYSTESWTKVRLAAAAAGQLVIESSRSGMVGSLKELTALKSAIVTGAKEAAPTSLVALALDSPLEERELEKLGQDKGSFVGVLQDAVSAVSTASPNELPAYSRFLVQIATQVAEASKEGGFLGIGGTRVSAEEQAAIDQIKSIAGVATA